MILARLLARAARRERRLALATGAAAACAWLAAGALATAGIDRFLRVDADTRHLLALLVWTLAGGWFIWRGALPALRPIPALRLARRADAVAGDAARTIAAAVELAEQPSPDTSPWMASRTRALAETAAVAVDTRRLVPATGCQRAAGIAAFLLLCTVGAALLPDGTRHLGRGLLPWLDLARPSAVRITVDPGDVRLATGSPLAVTITCMPDPGTVQVELLRPGRPPLLRTATALGGGRHRLTVDAVLDGFRYRVHAGDGESALFTVGTVDLPRPQHIRCTTEDPAYARRPGRQTTGGDAEVLAGGQVTITVRFAAQAPAAAAVVWNDGESALLPGTGGDWSARIAPLRSCDWRLHLVVRGADGALAAVLPETHRITVRHDAEPVVACDDPGRMGDDGPATVTLSAEDDVGLAAIAAEAVINGTTVPLPVVQPRAGERRCERRLGIDPVRLGLLPDEVVELRAWATDLGGRQSRPVSRRLVMGGRHALAAERLASAVTAAGDEVQRQGEAVQRAGRSWSQLASGGRAKDAALTRNQTRLANAIQIRAGRALDAVAQRLVAEAIAAEDAGHDAARVRQTGEALARLGFTIASLVDRGTGAGPTTSIPSAATHAVLVDQWREELGAIAARLVLHQARWQAVRHADTAQAAALRLRRDGDRLIAERAWSGPAGRPGLAGAFFRGDEPGGEAVAFAIGQPAVNGDPHGLTAPWCATWTGEVQIPAAGSWNFAVLTDDGARLDVAGWRLLPTTAWQQQAPTPYRATIQLAAGWHPIRIAYRQLGGGAVLIVSAGREGQPLAPLPLERLRCTASAIDDRTLHAMARLHGGVDHAAARAMADVARLTVLARALPPLVHVTGLPARDAEAAQRAAARLPTGALADADVVRLRDMQAAAGDLAAAAGLMRDALLRGEAALPDADGPRRRQQDEAAFLLRRCEALPATAPGTATSERLRQVPAELRAIALRCDRLATGLDRQAVAQRQVRGDAGRRAIAWTAALADAAACAGARTAADCARAAARHQDADGLGRLIGDTKAALVRLQERLGEADAINRLAWRRDAATTAAIVRDGLGGLRPDAMAQIRTALARAAGLVTRLRCAGAMDEARRLAAVAAMPGASTTVAQAWNEALAAAAVLPMAPPPPLRSAADALARGLAGLATDRTGATEELQHALVGAAVASLLTADGDDGSQRALLCRAFAATLVAETRQGAVTRAEALHTLERQTRRLAEGILPTALEIPAPTPPDDDGLTRRWVRLATQAQDAVHDPAARPALVAALRAWADVAPAETAPPDIIHTGVLGAATILAAVRTVEDAVRREAAVPALLAEAERMAAALATGTVNAPTLRALAERIAERHVRPVAHQVRNGVAAADTIHRARSLARLVGALETAALPLERGPVTTHARRGAPVPQTPEGQALEALAAQREDAAGCRRAAGLLHGAVWSRRFDALLARLGLPVPASVERGGPPAETAVAPDPAMMADDDAPPRPGGGGHATIDAGSLDRFGSEHRAAIRDYLRQLAEEER